MKALGVLAAAGMVPAVAVFAARLDRPAGGAGPGNGRASPTPKRHDASVTISFPRVNRGVITE